MIINIADTKSNTKPGRTVRGVVTRIWVNIKYYVIRIWGQIRNFTKATKFDILIAQGDMI